MTSTEHTPDETGAAPVKDDPVDDGDLAYECTALCASQRLCCYHNISSLLDVIVRVHACLQRGQPPSNDAQGIKNVAAN